MRNYKQVKVGVRKLKILVCKESLKKMLQIPSDHTGLYVRLVVYGRYLGGVVRKR